MAIRQLDILNRSDFDEAVVKLRLNVSDVAKATGIPRTYLSEFRNGDRKLRPEHQAKLRDFFESKGVEFDDQPAAAGKPSSQPGSPDPRLEATNTPRCFFPIDYAVPAAVVSSTLDIMEDNDARLAALFKQKAERDTGLLFGDGDFTDDTKAALQEAFALLAENYVLFRMLRGWRALGVAGTSDDPQLLRGVVLDTFRARLTEAGVIAPATEEAGAEQDGEQEEAQQ